MEPKQILSANLLDIIFDDRNKAYGAYELRVTYPERIKKSLLFTFTLGLLAFGGVVLANSLTPKESGRLEVKEVTLSNIEQEVEEPETLPEPEKQPEPQVQTQQYTEFNIVPEEEVVEPPPSQEDLVGSKIDVATREGVPDEGLATPQELDKGTGIIEEDKNAKSDEPFTAVEIDAKFIGNWEKFLYKNLNPGAPVDNGAPAGTYKVIVQFVVDVDGSVSNIKALTSHGYGMEQEAIRVLKKATKWEPAYQNNTHVKAYRTQPITFQIEAE
jgi:periplasmic protein TonB